MEQRYKPLAETGWMVCFEPKISNISTQYFEKFTGYVYIRFPKQNHLDHRYYMVDGDFVDIAAGKIENWGTESINMQQIVKEQKIEPQESRSRWLYTKTELYKYWQNQVSQNTLFTQTTKEWQTLYDRLNNDICVVRFRPDWNSYYDEWYSGSEEEINRNWAYDKVRYLEKFCGMVFVFVQNNRILNGTVEYDEYRLLMKNGDFCNWDIRKTNGYALSREKFKIEQLSGSEFVKGGPENIGLDMKIALRRYWYACDLLPDNMGHLRS